MESLTIHVGNNLLSETGVVYKAERAIIHDNFQPWELVNDIGLLVLLNLIEYTNLIKPISLATIDVVAPDHSYTLSGWGIILVSDKLNKDYLIREIILALLNLLRILEKEEFFF